MPARGRYKVYIIDEVHQLTGDGVRRAPEDAGGAAAARRLRARHDRPAGPAGHDPLARAALRLPADRARRCCRRRSSTSSTRRRSRSSRRRCRSIVRAAEGSLRDALSLLDTAIAYGNGRLEAETTATLLGATAPAEVRAFATALVGHDTDAGARGDRPRRARRRGPRRVHPRRHRAAAPRARAEGGAGREARRRRRTPRPTSCGRSARRPRSTISSTCCARSSRPTSSCASRRTRASSSRSPPCAPRAGPSPAGARGRAAPRRRGAARAAPAGACAPPAPARVAGEPACRRRAGGALRAEPRRPAARGAGARRPRRGPAAAAPAHRAGTPAAPAPGPRGAPRPRPRRRRPRAGQRGPGDRLAAGRGRGHDAASRRSARCSRRRARAALRDRELTIVLHRKSLPP